MYAIIEESGGQRQVSKDEVILVDLLEEGEAKVGTKIKFDKVLVVGDIGGKAKIGQPYVAGASVEGEIVEGLVKGDKVYVQHFQAKKTWRKKIGHRQRYTSVKVTAINA